MAAPASSPFAIRHSIAVPRVIIAASLYSQDVTPTSPLTDLVFSGYETQHISRTKELTPRPKTPPLGRDIGFALKVKQVLILSDPKLQCYDPEVVKQMLVQDHNVMTDELIDLNALWFTNWKKRADEATVPILYALGEHDWLWHGNKEHAQEFMGDSRRVRELKEVLLLADRICWSGGRA